MFPQRQCRSARRAPAHPGFRPDFRDDAPNDPIDDLRFIRETIERSHSFTAVPGWGQVILGVTALLAAPVAARQSTPLAWIAIWLIEAGLAVAISSVAMNYKSQRLGVPLVSGPARKFALGFLPPLAAGALVTVVLYRAGLSATLPGIWALIYGGAVISGGVLSVPLIPIMGACFMAAGAAALVLPQWGNYAMAATFGALHILFGFLIARKHGG